MSELKWHAPFRSRTKVQPAPKFGSIGSTSPTRPKHSVWDDESESTAAHTGLASSQRWKAYCWRLRVTDTLVIGAVVALAYTWRFGVDDPMELPWQTQTRYVWLSILIAGTWIGVLAAHHTRDGRIFGVGATEYKRVIHATGWLFGALAILMVIFRVDVVRGYFAVALPLGLILLSIDRWLWRRWLNRQRGLGKYLSKVAVIGEVEDVEYVIGQIAKNLSAGFKVVGVALPNLDKSMELRPPWYRIPVVSTMADVSRMVRLTGADAVIVAGNIPGGARYIRELGWQLEDTGTELVLASSLTNVAGPRIHWRPVEGLPLMHVELPQYAGGKHVFKRFADVVIAAIALTALSPVFLALALIVRLDGPGPVFFRQDRVGRNGSHFKMYKFRSMVQTAEEELGRLQELNEGAGVLFKIQNDPRVTKCGRWMRKFSLDELPQFWNVLLGDMSLVGPRPPLPKEVDGYEKPAHRRLLIKPGITGLWQISGRSNLSWEESIRLDLYYVENWCFTGDLIIMWRTFRAMRSPVGAY